MEQIAAIALALVIVVMLAAIVIAEMNGRRPFQIEANTAVAPDEAIRAAVQSYTMAGWRVTSRTDSDATFSIEQRGSCFTAAVLLAIGLIPGLLYLVFSRRTINANVNAMTIPHGSTVRISCTYVGFGGRATANRALDAISQ
jgi:hypothetical protein